MFKLSLLLMVCLFSLNLSANIKGFLKASKGGLEDYSSFIVYFEKGSEFPKIKRKPKTVLMAQVNKTFNPSVVGIQKNDEIDFINYDDIFHNVFSLNPNNKFDLGVFKGSSSYTDEFKKNNIKNIETKVQFKTPGKSHVFCNIHEDMMGIVYVFDHNYFSMANKSGIFNLPTPPNGEHVIIIDGNRLNKPIKKRFKFSTKTKKLLVTFDPSEEKQVVKHKNKKGEMYQEREWELDDDDIY